MAEDTRLSGFATEEKVGFVGLDGAPPHPTIQYLGRVRERTRMRATLLSLVLVLWE